MEPNEYLIEPVELPQPRKRLSEVVGDNIASQLQEIEAKAFYEAANEEPAFDKRSGTSNAGRRIAAKIQVALRGE
jgi:hypothetical protein